MNYAKCSSVQTKSHFDFIITNPKQIHVFEKIKETSRDNIFMVNKI